MIFTLEEFYLTIQQPLIEAFKISIFVLMVMMLTELAYLLNVSKSKFLSKYNKKSSLNILLALVLGLVPGCAGGFIAVSLYMHGSISFGALCAASIVALGDDAFRMMFLLSGETFLVLGILVVIGALSAFILNRIPYFNNLTTLSIDHIKVHKQEHKHIDCTDNLAKSKFHNCGLGLRLIIFSVVVLYILGLLFGILSHNHSHGGACEHTHIFSSHSLCFNFDPNPENIIFLSIALVVSVLIFRVDKHFLKEHLWGHVIKKHFKSIFLWTFFSLLFLNILNTYVDLEAWIQGDTLRVFYMLLFAILIGFLPQSGPHFIFIHLFATGLISLPILLANSIVQDGHSSLVLLSDSRKQFFVLKLTKAVIATIICVPLLLLF